MCSSYEYTDKVASLVQEAGYLQANLSSQEGDAASVPVSHIDGKDLNVDSTLNSSGLKYVRECLCFLFFHLRCHRHA